MSAMTLLNEDAVDRGWMIGGVADAAPRDREGV